MRDLFLKMSMALIHDGGDEDSSVQLSNDLGYFPSRTATNVLAFRKRNSLPSRPIQASISNMQDAI